MDLDQFKQSLAAERPPAGLSACLEALWRDGHGDWDGAHQCAQGESGADAAWVHAYLHRKEGDLSNADYWYRRAGRQRPDTPLSDEWEALVNEFLQS